jgi:uridine kinase
VNSEVDTCPEILVDTSESYYRRRVSETCDYAISQHKNIILLTGPSASGKTTTAILLANELMARGKKATRISLDNFYKDRDQLPYWEDGSRNYESIEGLDLGCFSDTVNKLMTKGEANFPIFDFAEGKRSNCTFSVKYDEDTYVIFEGIHALNPVFKKILFAHKCLNLYVSVHSDFTDDEGNVILCARDLRLIRRILRDNTERATPPPFTMDLWGKVVLGEDLYIRPHRENAEVHINSTHYYEPMVYKRAITQLLDHYKEDRHSEKFKQLLECIQPFANIPIRMLPTTSLLREFISETHHSNTPVVPPREL